jgi:Protein of unknown function (DUF3352)
VSQTLAFKRIDDALSRNEFSDVVQKSLLELFESGSPATAQLNPYVLRHGALALLPGADGTAKAPKGFAILPLSDGAAAQAVLNKVGVPEYFKGVKYYNLPQGRTPLMILGDQLLLAQDAQTMFAVKGVRDGRSPAIASDPHFIAARAHLADDANLMLFVSPKLAQSTGLKATDGIMADWISMGLAIRDGGVGLSLSTFGLMDTKGNPAISRIGQIAAVRSDLFKTLPSGAYGSIVLSQPTGYFEAFEPTLKKDESTRKGLAEMEDSLAKSAGMDFRSDLLPAFKGESVLAAYPIGHGSAKGVDLLAVIDDTNGGDPANAVQRLQNWAERQMEKEGKYQNTPWTSLEEKGAKKFQLSSEFESELQKSLGQGMPTSLDKGALIDQKTVAWAFVGKTVIASTNRDLLDRAVSAYQTQAGNMTSDAKFASSEREVLDDSQSLMMFSLSRVAEGVRNTFHSNEMKEADRKMFDGILDAFTSLDQPLTLRGRMQSDGQMSAGAFIPLDYDKLIDVVGQAMKKK